MSDRNQPEPHTLLPPGPLPPSQRRHTGNAYEQLAAEYLTAQGLQLIRSNYHCRLGEIDLIMQERDTLVFVEVRYRLHNRYGGPVLSINRQKQARVLRTAQAFLKHYRLSHAMPSRIDVVGITPREDGQGYHFQWVRNAIQASW
ncbi:MAG TPA: YraN family protein [Pseudohongiella sp.]|nr:YraN family protein [Pseudohongiella sp.]